jgi:hypothetical protein
VNPEFANLSWEASPPGAADAGGDAGDGHRVEARQQQGTNRMDSAALAFYAKQRGGIAHAVAGHIAVEVKEDGEAPVAFLLSPETFYLLLAAADDTQPNIAVSPEAEARDYMTSDELLARLGDLSAK